MFAPRAPRTTLTRRSRWRAPPGHGHAGVSQGQRTHSEYLGGHENAGDVGHPGLGGASHVRRGNLLQHLPETIGNLRRLRYFLQMEMCCMSCQIPAVIMDACGILIFMGTSYSMCQGPSALSRRLGERRTTRLLLVPPGCPR